jgi:lipopolysaccharide transport system permease protein
LPVSEESSRHMHEITIERGRASRQYWKDIWRYRELFYFLAWRDILIRFKQTVVGVAWALIRPLLTMVVLTIVFGKLAKLPSGGVPYPILVFCGMLPWQFFASALSESGNSLVGNANLISKIYFPRLIIPASSVITSLADFLISASFLVLLMIWYQYVPPIQVLLLPLFVCVAFAAAFGVGLWVAALMVKYRDFRFIIPFAVQFGLYISPVGFSSSVVPEKWRLLYSLNPMVGVIDGFRWAILDGKQTIYWPGFALSVAVVAIIVLTGIWYFRKTERSFADVI